MSFFRAIVVMLFVLPQVWVKKQSPIEGVPRDLRITLFKRTFFGQFGFLFYNFALTVLPYSTFFVIMNSSPIFTSLLAFIMLGEPIIKKEISAVLLCFSAVILIAFGKSEKEENSQFYSSIWLFQLGVLAISATAVIFSYVSVLTRKMKEISPTLILFWYAVFGIITLGSVVGVNEIIGTPSFFIYSLNAYLLTILGCTFNAFG